MVEASSTTVRITWKIVQAATLRRSAGQRLGCLTSSGYGLTKYERKGRASRSATGWRKLSATPARRRLDLSAAARVRNMRHRNVLRSSGQRRRIRPRGKKARGWANQRLQLIG